MSRFERWSRKKRGVESDEADAALDNPADGNLADDNAAQRLEADTLSAAVSDDESLDAEANVESSPPLPGSLDHTLPDPDHLPAGSDFSAFMVPGVSAALRRRALKRLWATGNYNVRDGLDDYDADYRQQLKPMATELAGKLRRWANKAEEALEQPAETHDENDEAGSADSTISTPSNDVNAGTSNADIAQKTPLDDQSDSSDGEVDKYMKNS
ncbi:DUF3306 domain-containing protein [Vreelandella andesensis]|uniref:DUF3306 domain-containing protein n=1 Tax=Vreelandella andesensis TaxID=447567 RepID=A0A3S0XWN7_9GAMM|nr:DUF3306 domain-containing protein [Halomonas andesensis]RUR31930.1 DUF3306 domain-containing protein [Halomonas andesensis]